jgi:hypothetical protein
MTTQEVPIPEAVTRLIDADIIKANRISQLEGQLDEILKSFTAYREEVTQSTTNELQTMSTKMAEKIEAVQATSLLIHQEATSKNEENRQEMKRIYDDMNANMNVILNKLNQMGDSRMTPLSGIQDREKGTEERPMHHTRMDLSSRLSTDSTTPTLGHPFGTTPGRVETESKNIASIPPVIPLSGVKHSIIVPPSSAAPAFYGKHAESPTQFLIRVQEYAESVHSWDETTLVSGISQFLRDSALEWYCQLRLSQRRPKTWTEFTTLFLAQFNSPVRKARQEQEWHECKQKENETINEFLVRLRALWREQKPKETETDLVKHLFCRMRSDLLTMIGISRTASLDEVITEVQQIEDVLYRRAKGERLAKQTKQFPSTNAEVHIGRTFTWPKKENTSNQHTKNTRNHHVNEVTPRQKRTTTESNTTQPFESYGDYCYQCGEYGHWAANCPAQHQFYRQEWNQSQSKNARGALDERASRAPM